jgi:magnesium-transporting ATPase (P-type)
VLEKRLCDFISARDPFIHAGSTVIEGEGQLIVCTVGQSTSSYQQFQNNLN